MAGINATTTASGWTFQDSYVERLLDNAAYTSAHPDDTLILAGPPRYTSGSATNAASFIDKLLPIGMMQSFSASQQKPVQPVMAIGSGRQFFVAGKAQTSWSIQRLFVNGRNLLRVLQSNIKQAGGVDVSTFDDPAASSDNDQFWMNLDSELFLIPFGLAVFFRDKTHGSIGAFYMELCMISSWSIGANAGGNMIAEAVTGLADRVLPISVSPTGASTNAPAASDLDSALGVADPNTSDINSR